jgi:tetratricopeptide (TPR) repeat protein
MQEAVRCHWQAIDEYTTAELSRTRSPSARRSSDLEGGPPDPPLARRPYAKEGFARRQIHYLEFAEGLIRRQDYDAALDVVEQVLKLSPDNAELSEKYTEIALRADQPERGGRELLRRAERATMQGRVDEAAQLRDRASTLAPGLEEEGVESGEPAPAETEGEAVPAPEMPEPVPDAPPLSGFGRGARPPRCARCRRRGRARRGEP